MLGPWRLRLMLAVVVPIAVLGGLAVWLGQMHWAIGAGLWAAALAAAAGAVALVTAPVAKLAATAAKLPSEEPVDVPAVPKGELLDVGRALTDMQNQYFNVSESFNQTLQTLTKAVQSFNEPTLPAAPPELATPFPETQQALTTALQEHGKQLVLLRQRLAMAMRTLQGVPHPVLALDARGVIRYMNQAAEKRFEYPNASWQRKTINTLLGVPPTEGFDPPLATPDGVTKWLQGGARGACHIMAVSSKRQRFPMILEALPGVTPADGLLVVVARELQPVMDRERDLLVGARARTATQWLHHVVQETEEHLKALAAQLRLLTMDAKQAGQRETMLPKVNTSAIHLHQLTAHNQLLHWAYRVLTEQLPVPLPAEFMPGDVAKNLQTQLAGRLKARKNTLKIMDCGAWVYGDEEWLHALLLGLLTHACLATADNEIKLTIAPAAATDGESFGQLELRIDDVGPALTSEMLQEVVQPFGDRRDPHWHGFPGVGGCPLGLIVAYRLAPALGGELTIDASPAGQAVLRFRMPTRLGDTSAAVAPALSDIGAALPEETVAGWRMGTAV